MILVGLLGLGVGTWLRVDNENFEGVVLAQNAGVVTLYKSTGEVINLVASHELRAGQIIIKKAGQTCCSTDSSTVAESLRAELKQRYERYWSKWSGTVAGFVMREHADDADTALVKPDNGDELVRWKVWEGDLAGLKQGERLCKSPKAWSPVRCNPEAGLVGFEAPKVP